MSGVSRVLVVAAALALVAGCGGERSSYTKDDVQKAFAGQGFELGTPEAFNKITPSSGALLIPRSGEPFMVTVGPNSEADAGWADYERLGAVADSFDARRVNVVVLSDGGMTAKQIERVLAALAALPDRGEIDVVSKRTDFERP